RADGRAAPALGCLHRTRRAAHRLPSGFRARAAVRPVRLWLGFADLTRGGLPRRADARLAGGLAADLGGSSCPEPRAARLRERLPSDARVRPPARHSAEHWRAHAGDAAGRGWPADAWCPRALGAQRGRACSEHRIARRRPTGAPSAIRTPRSTWMLAVTHGRSRP